jgi:hypothetical protein
MTDPTDWFWFAAGAATAIILGIGAAQLRYRRWLQRRSYVAEIEIHDRREDNDDHRN